MDTQQPDENPSIDSEWAALIELARRMRIPIEEVRHFIHNIQIEKV